MGEDIDGFRRLLGGYKLTISIALTDANLYVSVILLVESAMTLIGFRICLVANLPPPPKASQFTTTFSVLLEPI
jgi:hypothetical protein